MDAKARNLNLLRKSVSKKFGKEIRTANDCELLKEEVSKVCKTVSSQTYRRFFRVIVYNGCYSEFTLNGLSQYCGFPDYAAFKNSLIENEMDLLLEEINTTKSETEYWSISEIICQKIFNNEIEFTFTSTSEVILFVAFTSPSRFIVGAFIVNSPVDVISAVPFTLATNLEFSTSYSIFVPSAKSRINFSVVEGEVFT